MAEVRPGVHCVQNVRKKRHALPRHPCLSPEEAPCQGGPAGSRESERDFRDTVNTAVGKPLAAAVGTFSSNLPLPI